MGHSILSPSFANTWMNCSGSIPLIKQMKKNKLTIDKPNRFSSEGTVAHNIGEECLSGNHLPHDFIGKTYKESGFAILVTKEMADAVAVYVEYVNTSIDLAIDLMGSKLVILIEEWLDLTSLNCNDMDGGTGDCVLIDFDECLIEVVDYKHGSGVFVSIEDNKQLKIYGLACILLLLKKYKVKRSDLKKWTITTTIVQPRIENERGPIRSANYKATDLLEWGEGELVEKAKATQNPKAKRTPSEKGCQWCPAANTPYCKEQSTLVYDLALEDFKDFIDDEEEETIEYMDQDQIDYILNNADFIKKFLDKFQKYAYSQAMAGSQKILKTQKFIKGQARRSYIEIASDPDFSPLSDYLDEKEYLKQSIIGITELKTKLKENYNKEEIESILDEVTEKSVPPLKLVPRSNKSPEVANSAVSDFEDLIEEDF